LFHVEVAILKPTYTVEKAKKKWKFVDFVQAYNSRRFYYRVLLLDFLFA
jgi:hypothetical protein